MLDAVGSVDGAPARHHRSTPRRAKELTRLTGERILRRASLKPPALIQSTDTIAPPLAETASQLRRGRENPPAPRLSPTSRLICEQRNDVAFQRPHRTSLFVAKKLSQEDCRF